MKINNKKANHILLFTVCFLIVTQVSFAQKNNQKVIVNKSVKVLPKTSNSSCDCDKIDFKVRIIKLSATKEKTTYKLQLIDFKNKNKCEIKFFNLNWKGKEMILFGSMRNQTFERSSDDMSSLYEFEFDSKVNSIEPEDGAEIKTSILIKVGEKSCFLRDKQSTYYRQM